MAGDNITLETRGLTIRFGGHTAVDKVSCAFSRGVLTAIVGPNGAGKTTYFNLISGQLKASEGTVILNGRDITGLPASQRTALGLGRAFQLTNLFPSLSVFENVRLVVQAREKKGFDVFSLARSHSELADEANAILKRVHLAELADYQVSGLSHGDQRKLEVALMLAMKPAVFMFDEPTAGMSMDEAPVILDLIAEIKEQEHATILLVEHKMDVIRTLADRIIVLHNGALAADGEPAEVMKSAVVQEAYLGREIADV
ncbi:ABC transporter ATP-binding protein [Rhizobium sp. L1K21]|uniref:ABC transporter ATP-binding protein n=1 Tax=Rhizobium sp. L1K21 TaxID=2954933 RepID=UPI0020933A70|nr:ABC transporter ATP-binding protein [Rhizobium sp. L1K21]MCO6188291.1 ABC transporter ATP-binding protein [Rhizobium sp. L1K21]